MTTVNLSNDKKREKVKANDGQQYVYVVESSKGANLRNVDKDTVKLEGNAADYSIKATAAGVIITSDDKQFKVVATLQRVNERKELATGELTIEFADGKTLVVERGAEKGQFGKVFLVGADGAKEELSKQGVDADDLFPTDAPTEEPAGTLTAKLQALLDAQAEETAALADAAKNAKVAENLGDNDEPSNEEVNTAIDAVLTDVTDDLDAAIAAGTYDPDAFTDATDRVKASIIADAKEEFEDAVAEAQKEVNKTAGLSNRIDTLVLRKQQLESAAVAADEAKTDLEGEAGKYAALNGALIAEIGVTIGADAAARADFVVTNDGTNLIAVVDGKLVITDDGKSTPGIDALFSAAKAYYDSILAGDRALSNFETAIERVQELADAAYDADTFDATDSYDETTNFTNGVLDVTDGKAADLGLEVAEVAQDLIDAKLVLQAFNDALTAYNEIKALDDSATALEKAVDDAMTALEDAGYEVQLVDGGVAGTLQDDVFLFQADTAAEDLVISAFNEEGSDVLYVGTGYTLNVLGADADLASQRLGDASALEIFVQQKGADTILYVEADAFAGNDLNLGEITTITLTGVNASELNLAGGFLSLVAAA